MFLLLLDLNAFQTLLIIIGDVEEIKKEKPNNILRKSTCFPIFTHVFIINVISGMWNLFQEEHH